MLIKRRKLLQLAGLSGLGALLGRGRAWAVATGEEASFLVDTSICTGCRLCVQACKKWNRLPAEEQKFTTLKVKPMFSAINWISIHTSKYVAETGGREQEKWLHTRLSCMHCTDAACVQVCPSGALSHTVYGTVSLNERVCIACNYCVSHCPFTAVSFDKAMNVARKCTFCHDRLQAGLIPACAHACPNGTIKYGTRKSMEELAFARVQELRRMGSTKAEAYGIKELKGLGVLYVLEKGRENCQVYYGLPDDPQVSIAAKMWNSIFKPARLLAFLGVVFVLWLNKTETKIQE